MDSMHGLHNFARNLATTCTVQDVDFIFELKSWSYTCNGRP